MRLHAFVSHYDLSFYFARRLAKAAAREPGKVVVFPAGNSTTLACRLFVAFGLEGRFCIKSLVVGQLDEFAGIPSDHPGTCRSYLAKHILEPLCIPPERFIAMNANAQDRRAECERFTSAIHAHGGVSAMLLGLGINGHVGMNEPSDTSRMLGTHYCELTSSTRGHSMLQGTRNVHAGMTMGLRDISEAGEVFVLASGKGKIVPLAHSIFGCATPRVPLSEIVRWPNVVLGYDQETLDIAELSR